MRVLPTDDLNLIHGRSAEIQHLSGYLELRGLNTFLTGRSGLKSKTDHATAAMKMSESNRIEIIQTTRKSDRKVIFYRFGFFTIRVLPRSGHSNLSRLATLLILVLISSVFVSKTG